MLLIKACLPTRARDISNYIAAWTSLLKATGSSRPRQVQRALFDHLYENLNILDAKTSSLIQLNGLLITGYIFVVSGDFDLDRDSAPLFVLGLAYTVIALLLCLRVIWIHWSSRADLRDPDAHIRALIRIRSKRTIEFRRAWTFTAISIAAIVITVIDDFAYAIEFKLNLVTFVVTIAHFATIYLYDDLILAARERNIALRAGRLATALRQGRMRWRIIRRALQMHPTSRSPGLAMGA